MVFCEEDSLLQHQWLQQHAIAVLHYPGVKFDDASPKTLYIRILLLNSQSLRWLAIHSGAGRILAMSIIGWSQWCQRRARRCFSCICAIAGQATECTTECGITDKALKGWMRQSRLPIQKRKYSNWAKAYKRHVSEVLSVGIENEINMIGYRNWYYSKSENASNCICSLQPYGKTGTPNTFFGWLLLSNPVTKSNP